VERGWSLSWAGIDLVGEVTGQALVAGVDLGGDLGIVPQQIGDTFGAYGGGVMHPARAHRTKPQQPAGTVADRGRFDRVLLLPARDERAPSGPPCLGTADLHLGAVDAECDTFGRSVGEHVGQGAQPQLGLARHGEPSLRHQWPDLMDGPGDRRAVHPVEHRQGGMRQLEPQDHQGRDDPVDEGQLTVGTGTLGAPTVPATATLAQA